MARFLIAFVLLLVCGTEASATHNRAGEITYRHLFGLTYEFTITTCTRTSSPADRPVLEINYGDNTGLDSVPRINIIPQLNDAQINVYVDTHTYAGPGIFTIFMEDPNRNDGVLNIPNSVQTPFCVMSRLVISPFGGHNNSVQLDNPAKDNACVFKKWVHNPAAYDVDGDSLVFSLIDCLGENCAAIPNYVLPNGIPNGSGTFTIDQNTGLVEWNAPAFLGEYNIAILIEEYRNGVFIGSVIRDMQITVVNCDNDPPQIIVPEDTCVIAGTFLQLDVFSYDPNGDNMTIYGAGAPFNVASSPANMGSTFSLPPDSATAQFNWQTTCDHVKAGPYATTFRVEDQDPVVDLSDAATMYIQVIAPAPLNPLAVPNGNQIEITWDPSICANATGYKIYRRFGQFGFVPSYCETGVPSYTGYTFIGSTQGLNSTAFYDTNNLVHGEEYCYMIVACFADGAQSIASIEVCARLNLDLPVILNADVVETDVTNGEVFVAWFNPIELDSVTQWPGPYHYELYRSDGFSTPTTLIQTTPVSTDLYLTQSQFTDLGPINTETSPYSYQALLYSNGILVGSTHKAATIFLSLTANDNQMDLSWTESVPWVNDSFEVYRQDPAQSPTFVLVGTTANRTFSDTGLINLHEYCYYVRSKGSYSDSNIPTPLYNRSQIACGHPTDLTPPCPPTLTIDGDCELAENYLSWTNPNNGCSDDVQSYNLYYAETETSDFVLINTFTNEFDTSFVHNNDGSIAGCYYVTASDSINPDFGVANESDSSNVVCIDNCPAYRLPNVFSPNGDGQNDIFGPWPYKYVKDVNIVIYNRWGSEIFKTTDPDINWDGKAAESGKLVSDGVYFYVCIVNTIRLSGIEPVVLKGTIQVFSGDSNNIE